MSKKDLVSEEVLQELINKLEEIVNNYCYNLEYFTPTDIEGFFDGTQQEIDYYSSLIKDDVVSKNFLHSSKQIADDIAQSILEANEYTDSLLKNISSIQLKYVTSLPTSDISENTIYILKASDSSSKDTLNLYDATDGWTSIGDFNISLDDYYNKTEIDTKMDLKANKTEVVANDKIVQTLGATTNSSDTVLSTSGLQTEMDKKANDDEVIKKTDLTTTIDSSSTDTQVPTARAVYNNINKDNNMKTYTSLEQLGLTAPTTVGDIYNSLPNNSCLNIFASLSSIIGLPSSNGLLSIRKSDEDGFDIVFKKSISSRKAENIMYIGQLKGVDGSELSWSRLCTFDDTDIHITSAERTKWNNVDNKVDKANITTTLDSTSTDTQVPSAKAVYDNSLTKGIGEGNTVIPDGSDLNDYLTPGVYTCFSSVSAETLLNCPHKESNFKLFVNKNTGEETGFYGYQMIVGSNFSIMLKPCVYYRSVLGDKSNPTYSKWQRLCSTTVTDVAWTELTLDSGMNGTIDYRIKNGICYVKVDTLKSSTMSTNGQTIVTGLPVPEKNAWYSLISSNPSQGSLLVHIDITGKMVNNAGLDNVSYFGLFSYPVAE